MASRPAQGDNSKPVKLGRPAFQSGVGVNATPKPVSLGSVSRPAKRGKWNPKAQPAPRRVSNPRTV